MGKGVINKRKVYFGEKGNGFYHADYLFLLWNMKKANLTDYLLGVYQHITDYVFGDRLKRQLYQVLNLGLVS